MTKKEINKGLECEVFLLSSKRREKIEVPKYLITHNYYGCEKDMSQDEWGKDKRELNETELSVLSYIMLSSRFDTPTDFKLENICNGIGLKYDRHKGRSRDQILDAINNICSIGVLDIISKPDSNGTITVLIKSDYFKQESANYGTLEMKYSYINLYRDEYDKILNISNFYKKVGFKKLLKVYLYICCRMFNRKNKFTKNRQNDTRDGMYINIQKESNFIGISRSTIGKCLDILRAIGLIYVYKIPNLYDEIAQVFQNYPFIILRNNKREGSLSTDLTKVLNYKKDEIISVTERDKDDYYLEEIIFNIKKYDANRGYNLPKNYDYIKKNMVEQESKFIDDNFDLIDTIIKSEKDQYFSNFEFFDKEEYKDNPEDMMVMYMKSFR